VSSVAQSQAPLYSLVRVHEHEFANEMVRGDQLSDDMVLICDRKNLIMSLADMTIFWLAMNQYYVIKMKFELAIEASSPSKYRDY
jgi:hypothetical protein